VSEPIRGESEFGHVACIQTHWAQAW
jgi:hypothetical protein